MYKMRGIISDIKYLRLNKRRTHFGNSEEECTICYGVLSSEPAVTTPCNHTFHTRCLCSWLETNKQTCPYCRRVFQPEEISSMCPGIVKKPRAKRKLSYNDFENPARRQQLGMAPPTTVSW